MKAGRPFPSRSDSRDIDVANSSLFYTEDHEAFREQLRRFVAKEIRPHAFAWDEAGSFPRELYRKAAEVGMLQIGFPERFGGVEADRFYTIILHQELARGCSNGVAAALNSHTISMPALARLGSEALTRRVLSRVLSGEKIAALACTEPSGGSDVGAIRTTATRVGDHYVLSGEKTFITSGMRADYFTVVARTGGPGTGGLSLFLLEGDTPGLQRSPLKKMGWLASDTATLFFDDCRVAAENRIGAENSGFKALAESFNDERLGLAAASIGYARVAFEEARNYAQQRETFGKRLSKHQVIRHKLVDMAQRIETSQAYLELTAWQMDHGLNPVADVCMLKNQATQTLDHCASEAVQIFGGAGYLRGSTVELIYRDVKPNVIGGGSEEIMKELAGRCLGL